MPVAVRKTLLSLMLAASTILVAAPGHAADTGGKFAVRGFGSETCGAYLAALAKPDDFIRYGAWLLGYATAHNRLDAGTYDIIPTETGVDFANVVAVICRTNPRASLETAANDAIRTMAPMRQLEASSVVQVQADGKTVAIRQESLKRLQSALIGRNLYKGPANGASSPQFVSALKDFQRREAIPVTGLPDIDTFIRAIIKR